MVAGLVLPGPWLSECSDLALPFDLGRRGVKCHDMKLLRGLGQHIAQHQKVEMQQASTHA